MATSTPIVNWNLRRICAGVALTGTPVYLGWRVPPGVLVESVLFSARPDGGPSHTNIRIGIANWDVGDGTSIDSAVFESLEQRIAYYTPISSPAGDLFVPVDGVELECPIDYFFQNDGMVVCQAKAVDFATDFSFCLLAHRVGTPQVYVFSPAYAPIRPGRKRRK